MNSKLHKLISKRARNCWWELGCPVGEDLDIWLYEERLFFWDYSLGNLQDGEDDGWTDNDNVEIFGDYLKWKMVNPNG